MAKTKHKQPPVKQLRRAEPEPAPIAKAMGVPRKGAPIVKAPTKPDPARPASRRRARLERDGWEVREPIKFATPAGEIRELKPAGPEQEPRVIPDDEISDADVLMFEERGCIVPNMVEK